MVCSGSGFFIHGTFRAMVMSSRSFHQLSKAKALMWHDWACQPTDRNNTVLLYNSVFRSQWSGISNCTLARSTILKKVSECSKYKMLLELLMVSLSPPPSSAPHSFKCNKNGTIWTCQVQMHRDLILHKAFFTKPAETEQHEVLLLSSWWT